MSDFVYRSLLFKSAGKIKIYRLWLLNNMNADFFLLALYFSADRNITDYHCCLLLKAQLLLPFHTEYSHGNQWRFSIKSKIYSIMLSLYIVNANFLPTINLKISCCTLQHKPILSV